VNFKSGEQKMEQYIIGRCKQITINIGLRHYEYCLFDIRTTNLKLAYILSLLTVSAEDLWNIFYTDEF